MALGKEKESKLEKMVMFMMVNGKKINWKGRENILEQVVKTMRVDGKIIKKKGKENIPMLQMMQIRKKNTLANGHETGKIDKAHLSILMDPRLYEYGKAEKSMMAKKLINPVK